MKHLIHRSAWYLPALVLAWNLSAVTVEAQVVPGTGQLVESFGDDFEDENWKWIHNWPKSTEELDGVVRPPLGFSANRKWGEGAKRGHPDYIVRVETPEGGLPGSKGALLIRSSMSGFPSHRTGKSEQDDLILKPVGSFPVSMSPNAVVRVYLPPMDQWENRTGSMFAFRGNAFGSRYKMEEKKGLFGTTSQRAFVNNEEFWPGMFITHVPRDGTAHFVIRCDEHGRDYRGPDIATTGWWTLGMSFTPDGRVHYYGRPGIEDLRPEDHMGSHMCYGIRCHTFKTIFFDTFNTDDGRTWSTPLIVDDPKLYVIPRTARGR